MLRIISNQVVVCSLETVYGGVNVNTCKGMVAQLIAAKASQSTVRLWFDNSIAPAMSCASNQSWVALSGSATGWYFGPSLE
jgi:hypothetical protein